MKDPSIGGHSFPYMYSKAAIGHAAALVAHELLPLGIRCNGIAPLSALNLLFIWITEQSTRAVSPHKSCDPLAIVAQAGSSPRFVQFFPSSPCLHPPLLMLRHYDR